MRGRRLWLIFAALCCVPVLVFLLSFNLFREFAGDAEQANLMMGDQRVLVDRAYSDYADYPAGSHVEQILYRALLPGMTSKRETGSFEAPHPDEIVITLDRISPIWNIRPAVKHASANSERAESTPVAGLHRTGFVEDPEKDLFYHLSDTGEVDWFAECDKPETEDMPQCHAVERLPATPGISYSFPQRWIENWQQVRRSVNTFVSERLQPQS